MTAISDYLGHKQYLLGDRPCQADLTLFGFMSMMRALPPESRTTFKRHLEANCGNLIKFHERLKESFWPDYDQANFENEKKYGV